MAVVTLIFQGCPPPNKALYLGLCVPIQMFYEMAQLLEALTTDPMVSRSSPLAMPGWHDQTFTWSEESRQLSVFPGEAIACSVHIEKGPGHCSISKSFSVS